MAAKSSFIQALAPSIFSAGRSSDENLPHREPMTRLEANPMRRCHSAFRCSCCIHLLLLAFSLACGGCSVDRTGLSIAANVPAVGGGSGGSGATGSGGIMGIPAAGTGGAAVGSGGAGATGMGSAGTAGASSGTGGDPPGVRGSRGAAPGPPCPSRSWAAPMGRARRSQTWSDLRA